MEAAEDGELDLKVTGFSATTIDKDSQAHQMLNELWSSLKANLLSKGQIDGKRRTNHTLTKAYNIS